MAKFKQSLWPFAEFILPWVMLVFLGIFTVGYFAFLPYAGIQMDRRQVSRVFTQPGSANSFQVGDLVLQVGEVTAAEVDGNLTQGFFRNLQPGAAVDVVVERQGNQVKFPFTYPGISAQEIFNRLNSQWFMPYIFWLAGTTTLLFLRPRSQLRLLLALFCFLTAAWLGSSSLSDKHFLNAALVLRSAVWLSVPVYLHLHWQFPAPLRRLPAWVWASLYALCTLLAVFSWLQLFSQNFYFFGFILAVVGSIILIIVHLITQREERRALGGLVAALGMVLIPVIGMSVLYLLNTINSFEGILILGLGALPGFYFFTLFRRQLNPSQFQRAGRLVRVYLGVIVGALLFCGVVILLAQSPAVYQELTTLYTLAGIFLIVITIVNFAPFLLLPALANENLTPVVGGTRLSFSANRFASGVFFVLLSSLVILIPAFFIQNLDFPEAPLLSLILAVLTAGALALAGYPLFKRFFEYRVLGMPLAPESLAAVYSGRITTSLELNSLRQVLLEEVVPSLLVRQFAHLEAQNSTLTPLFTLRVTPEMLPESSNETVLARSSGRWIRPDSASALPPWVRLVIPVKAAEVVRGYWLLGQRDPDDRYAPEDIATLCALADQTALALVNIDQAESLRALYYADIDRGELERNHLAAELHDDVLNQLAVLSLNLQDASPATLAAYDQATGRIRDIINGLRPAMLNYGLPAALETLTDELNDRLPDGPRVVNELEKSDIRFDNRVELYLFRIAQQACENAIRHAACRTIRITGRLVDSTVELAVSDDGVGFPAGRRIDLPGLLADRHFGLAGMFERAALIGADLEIQSQPGLGCQVNVSWQKK